MSMTMTTLLDVRDICAWYGDAQVLHGVDLRIEAGEIVALLGRNGSGRSSFAKALMGLVRRAGSVRLAGEEVVGLATFELARRGIGYVAEQRDVFPTLSVEENLLLGVKPGISARVARAVIDDVYERFAMLSERRTTKAGSLSGGEQQMLALVRALIGEPRLLIVDEPAEGLAPQAVAEVAQCLSEVARRGGAVLLIEQRLAVAHAIAARAAVMGHGRIVFDGSIEALDTKIVNEWMTVGGG
jgi:branched-chain amino acid transport system ATP-binding protein